MFRLLFVTVAAALFASSTAALAAGQQVGNVKSVVMNKSYGSGVIAVGLTGTPTGKPACATDTSRWVLVMTDSNPLNSSVVSLVLTALSTGRPVMISGTGACTVIPDVEDIDAVTTP